MKYTQRRSARKRQVDKYINKMAIPKLTVTTKEDKYTEGYGSSMAWRRDWVCPRKVQHPCLSPKVAKAELNIKIKTTEIPRDVPVQITQ